MPLNFNTAEVSAPKGELIPHGTRVPVHMTVRPRGAGDGGWLKRSERTDALMIDAEFTVLEGNEYAKRKIWTYFVVDGPKEGHQTAAASSRSSIRQILESARGIKPSDTSPEAVAGRQIEDYGDLDGLRFWMIVKIERGKDDHPDRNQFSYALTPDRQEWSKLEQAKRPAAPARPASSSAPAPARPASTPRSSLGGSERPAWAGTGGHGKTSDDLNDPVPF